MNRFLLRIALGKGIVSLLDDFKLNHGIASDKEAIETALSFMLSVTTNTSVLNGDKITCYQIIEKSEYIQ